MYIQLFLLSLLYMSSNIDQILKDIDLVYRRRNALDKIINIKSPEEWTE